MTKSRNKRSGLFSRFSLVTLIAVYFLILVGGIVRSTGSGMGCPDWPKCFGQWVPPTEAEELPPDYKEIYSSKRIKKNIRFAKYLDRLGFSATADRLLNDESIKEEADFNTAKTWTEYINRLVGVSIGFFIIITFILSAKQYKHDKVSFWLALAVLLLVVFQGWIGSVVVSTNLVPWMVTVHMLLALAIVALLIFMVYRVNKSFARNHFSSRTPLFIILAGLIAIVVQIILGTEVREGVDQVASSLSYEQRDVWLGAIGNKFLVHRSFSWILVILHVILVYLLYKKDSYNLLAKSITLVLAGSLITGLTMAYFDIPAFAQPIHLLLGSVLFGLQFLLLLQVNRVTGKVEYQHT